MSGLSNAHVVGQIERIRRRARELLGAEEPFLQAATPDDDVFTAHGSAGLRLPRLAALFQLRPLAVDALVCLLAAEYDPSLRTLIRSSQREIGRPCLEIGTIAELLDLPLERVPELVHEFDPAAPLRAWALADGDDNAGGEPAVFQRFKLASRVARYLVDDDTLLDGIALFVPNEWSGRIAPARTPILDRAFRAAQHGAVAVEIIGKPNTGRREIARALAHRLERPLVALDMRSVEAGRLARRLAELRREARLGEAIPVLLHWDVLIPPPPAPDDHAAAQTVARRQLPAALIQLFETLDGPVMLIAEEQEPLVGFHAPAVVTIEVPFPSPAERARLFDEALRRRDMTPRADVDLESITRRYPLDAPHIEVAARTAADEARSADPNSATVSHVCLVSACRQQVKHDLKSLAERVENSHRWEQLVIPVDVYHSLEEMIAYVRHAKKVYEDWGFAGLHSLARGVSALFAGPPGTGKTMCASVMARELDMELFRVDLSRVVSKWIGETEKNLAKVFNEAQHSNAIILFDEADSLFAKRTEVKSSVDRYANLEVNFLLQRMEAFGGVTILTTNFEDTIDTAFKRRLTFRMRFEKPDADARAALWEKVFPRSCDVAEDVDMRRLAELFEMSGGNIRSAALRAAFLAAEGGTAVTMDLCLRAAERESREMGLLTRKVSNGDAPDVAANQSSSANEQDQRPDPGASASEDAAIRSSGRDASARARLVPITHPRSR